MDQPRAEQAADALRGTVSWAHHSPASATPLFLIAAAIAAVSIGRPPEGRHGLLRLVAVLAFTAWGTGQIMPTARQRAHSTTRRSCSSSSTAAARWWLKREPSWPITGELRRQPRSRAAQHDPAWPRRCTS
jgi:hypothetical protein